jgi:hypothetical protein
MKNRLLLGLILFIFLLPACTSTADSPTPTVGAQPTVEMTSEDFAMQTIIAREQSTSTPTPDERSNLTNPWTELTTQTVLTPYLTPTPYTPSSTPTPVIPAMAQAPGQASVIYQGPGENYKIACYVDEGTQLSLSGRNMDSSWFTVTFLQDQTCFALAGSIIHPIVIPDATKQYWIFGSSYTLSGNLSGLPIISAAP